MTGRTVRISAVILFAAGALFFLFQNHNKPERVVSQKCINACRSFELHSSSQNIQVAMNDGTWSVFYNGQWYPGDETKIQAFIKAMETMKLYAKSGTTEDVWHALGVDAAHAVKLKCRGILCEKEIYFGKRVENSPYIFIREGEKIQTYEADFPSAALFQDIYYWMELKIFNNLTPSRIDLLIFYRTAGAFKVLRTFADGKDVWVLEKSEKKSVLRDLPVHNLLEQIVNMKGDGLSDVSTEGMNRLGWLEIFLSQGENHILSFYKDSGNKIYLTVDRSSPLYLLSTAQFHSVFPPYIKILNSY